MTSKFIQWGERLGAFDFKIDYILGSSNAVADYLSGLRDRAEALGIPENAGIPDDRAVGAVNTEELVQGTAEDEDFQRIQESIRSKAWKDFQLPDKKQMTAFYGVRNELKILRGLLFLGNRIIPPSMLRREVLRCAHEGHPGMKRSKAALRSHFCWPGMDHTMEDYINNCGECARSSKLSHVRIPGTMLRSRSQFSQRSNGHGISQDHSAAGTTWLPWSTTSLDSRNSS